MFNYCEALCELTFDGSLPSLKVCLGNCTANQKLRAYGLPLTVTFVLKNLPDLYVCEQLHKTDQILVLHDNNLLLRVTNTSLEVMPEVLQIEVRVVLAALSYADSKTHIKLVKEKIRSEFGEAVHSAWELCKRPFGTSRGKNLLAASVVGVAAGIVAFYVIS